ncbi:MAG: hypothetical protein AAGD43_02330 [Pseudomonadota bacterium]
MQRLLKNWKVIAYFAGLIAVGSYGNVALASIYVWAGIAWLVYWIVKIQKPMKLPNDQEVIDQNDGGYYGIGARYPSGLQRMRLFDELR